MDVRRVQVGGHCTGEPGVATRIRGQLLLLLLLLMDGAIPATRARTRSASAIVVVITASVAATVVAHLGSLSGFVTNNSGTQIVQTTLMILMLQKSL